MRTRYPAQTHSLAQLYLQQYPSGSQVSPGLWVGSLPAEQCPLEELQKRSITHVLRCGLLYVPAKHEDTLAYLKLDVVDLPSSDILSLCRDNDTNTFIENARKAGGVLVHCQAGVSRSATVATAYLMCSQHIGSEKALRLIQASRPCVGPNIGFRAQLKALEEECNCDIAKYTGAPGADEHFTPAERAARGREWLNKRSGVDVPKPLPTGVWKPKRISPVLPPAEVLAPDANEGAGRGQ
ncbi:hypothetical protein WJX84_007101 [Apatococcus fuscideae]|uniref:Protein-tyrosine-phosphatase n=1 Tax=Apatococcus fuscideae TaxID=2026836 RepID=A0AAW1T774_9CHLO